MATGNIGPRRTPIKDIAMTLPIREGVNHIIISKLFDLRKVQVTSEKWGLNFTRLPKYVDEYDASLSDLLGLINFCCTSISDYNSLFY